MYVCFRLFLHVNRRSCSNIVLKSFITDVIGLQLPLFSDVFHQVLLLVLVLSVIISI